MKVCISKNNITSQIIDPIPDLIAKTLYDKLSYEVKGSAFISIVRQKIWDGRHHLFSLRTFKFPTGIVHRVVDILSNHEIEAKVVDVRIKPQPTLDLSFQGTLRPYQEEDLRVLANSDRGIINWVMGAGKSIENCALIAEKRVSPVLILVHTRDLLYQVAKFIKQFLNYQPGLIGDSEFEIKDITVAIVHSLYRKINDPKVISFLNSVTMCLFEECHHCPADMFYKVSKYLRNAYYRFGNSGTPWREDNKDILIEAITGPQLVKRNFSDLVKYRYLVRPTIYFVPVKKGIFKIDNKLVEIKGSEVSQLSKYKNQRYGWIYDKWITINRYRNDLIARFALYFLLKRKPILILVNRIKHGQRIKETILQYKKCDVRLLTGNVKIQERSSVFNDIRNKNVDIVIATPLADEGIDIPSIDCLILTGASKSLIKALQRIGRALRPSEGKGDSIIIEFKDYIKYLKGHSNRRFNIYKNEPEFVVKRLSDIAIDKLVAYPFS